MNENTIKKITDRKEKLLKSVEILDKMLETGDESLLEKKYWDDVVDEFYNPQSITDNLKDGLSDEEKEQLDNI